MAFTTTPYCTRADVKIALDPNMNTSDDTFIDTLILQAQADLDREIGYPFQQDGTTQTPAVRYYDGNDKAVLFIDNFVSLSSKTSGAVFDIYTPVTLQGAIWVAGSTVTQDITADIVWKPNNPTNSYFKLQRRSGIPFDEGLQNYEVHGIFGEPYLPGQVYPGVPNDIMRACTRLVIHYYKMRDTNYADMTQEQGGVRERFNKAMPQDVVEIIERYRRRYFVSKGQ